MRKKALSIALAMSVTLSGLGIKQVGTMQSNDNMEEKDNKEYLVLTKNNNVLDDVTKGNNIDNISNQIDGSLLSDANISVLSMNERTAQEVSEEKNIYRVEENIKFTGQGEQISKDSDNGEIQDINTDVTSKQWNLSAINWNNKLGDGHGIKVAVLDGGVSYNLDLDNPVDIRINNNDKNIDSMYIDVNGHGTGVAGIIGAKHNNIGISGIAPNADIYSIKVLNDDLQGKLDDVVAGIYSAIENKCNIINMSFGTTVDSAILHKAVRDAYDAGILMIASAGNSEGDVMYPAAYSEVMAVGATNEKGQWMSDTAGKDQLEILAPGNKILVTSDFEGTMCVEGTSVSAAQVSGAAALIWSTMPDKSADYIRRLMTATTQNVNNCNVGLLDIQNCIDKESEFANEYKKGETEYVGIEVNDAEQYNTQDLVNAMFETDNHADIAGSAAKDYSISANNLKLMKKAAKVPDDEIYSLARMLHGAHNYVRTLHCMYQCTIYLGNGDSVDDAVNKGMKDAGMNTNSSNEASVSKAFSNLWKGAGNKSENENIIKGHQTEAFKYVVKKVLKRSLDSNINENTPSARKYKALGLTMHLIGDTYAHRAIVPSSAVQNCTNTKTGAKFAKSDFKSDKHSKESDDTLIKWAEKSSAPENGPICKQWKCFKRAVELGVIEYRDIYHFCDGVGTRAYEDNKNFWTNRYDDARLRSTELLKRITNKTSYDGIAILHSTRGTKLNAFKYNSVKANEPNYNSYNSRLWTSWSTEQPV